MSTIVDINHSTGDLTQYTSTVTDSGDLSVTAGAALAGTNYGLSCLIDSTGNIYGQKATSQAATLRWRFYIDINSLTMAASDNFTTMYVMQAAGSYLVLAGIQIQYSSGQYWMQLVANNDADGWPVYDFVGLTDAPHYVEIQLIRSTNAGSNNGSIQWWFDGVDQGTTSSIDNYNLMFDQTLLWRLGVVNADAGTSGTLYLDELVANDDGGAIGPVTTTIAASQQNQAQVSNAVTLGAITPISPSQQNQAQVSNAVTLGAITPLTIAQNNQAQKSDTASLGALTPLAASQQNQAQVSDAATLGAIHPIAPSQQAQAQKSDIATLGAITPIAASQQAQAQVSDVASLSVVTPLAASQQNQAQVSDAATLGVTTPLSAADNRQAQVSDAAGIGVIHPLTASQQNQAQVTDSVTISAIYPASVAEGNQAQVSDAVTISAYYPISAAEANQAQVSDAASVTAIYPFVASENNQAQVSDAAILTAGETAITAAENRQAQVSDAVILTVNGPVYSISAAENHQAQAVDTPGLGVVYVIDPAQNYQAQVSNLAVLSLFAGIGHGTRRLYEFNMRSDSTFAPRENHTMKTRVDLEVDD